MQTSSLRGIDDHAAVYDALEALSREIGMTLVYPPLVARFPFASSELERFVRDLAGEPLDDAALATVRAALARREARHKGISGVAVWLESHASIHTWPEERFFSFDAYSCRDFEPEPVVALLRRAFDVAAWEGLDITRTIGGPPRVTRMSSATVA